MATYVPPKRATAYRFWVSLIDQTNTKKFKSSATLAAGDVKVSKDGGATANLTTLPAVTPAASVFVQVDLSATEMTADNVSVTFIDAAGAEWCDLFINLQTAARQIDDLQFPNVSGRGVDVDATGGVEVGAWLGSVPNTLVSGRMDSSTGAMAANVLTATAINADAITAAKIADAAIDAATFAADTGLKPVNTGTVPIALTTTNMIQIANAASTTDGIYKDYIIRLTGGTGVGQERRISWYESIVGPNNYATISPPWFTVPDVTTTYAIFPSTRPAIEQGLVSEHYKSLATGENVPHTSVVANGKLFIFTDTIPCKAIRFNTPRTNLDDYEVLTLPADGLHDSATKVVFSKQTGRLYHQFANAASVCISSFDPDAPSWAGQTIVDLVHDTGNVMAQGSLATLGGYLYSLTQESPSVVIKYNITTGARVTSTTLTGKDQGHAMDTDGTWLFATGHSTSPGWIARIDPVAMTFTAQDFDSSTYAPTNKFAIIGDHVWVGCEVSGVKGQIVRIRCSDITNLTYLSAGPYAVGIYGITAAMGYIWAAFNSSPSKVAQINPDTLDLQVHPLPNGQNTLNEMVTDGQRIYCATFETPSRIVRWAVTGLPALSHPPNIAGMVINGTTGAVTTDSATIADAVWDEVVAIGSTHNTVSTAGWNSSLANVGKYHRRGVAQAGTATTITLDAAANGVDDIYKYGLVITYPGGVGAEPEVRRIVGYVGSTKVATVDRAWANTPNASTQFVITAEAPVPIAAVAIDADTDVYSARITLIDDNAGTTDRYVVNWYKNGQDVISGITSPTIRVVKASDGSDLIASTAMTQIASTGAYRYDATTTARVVSGAAYFVIVGATIGGSARTYRQGWGRDS